MARLGGEYDTKERHFSSLRGRKIFLRRVKDLAPEVVRSLNDDVLPDYEQILDETRPQAHTVPAATESGQEVRRKVAPEWVRWRWEQSEWQDFDENQYGELVLLRDALLAWAERYHLTEHWVLDAAMLTLRGLCEREALEPRKDGFVLPFDPGELEGFADPYLMDTVRVGSFEFECPGWIYTMQSWRDYEGEVLAAVIEHLKTYRAQMSARARVLGLPESTQKRERHGEPAERHFDWLVRFQVQEWTQSTIARHCGKKEKTVQDALQKTAHLIGLTRRTKQ